MVAEEIEVVVVGGGQAGLATSHELSARGVDHLVLEAEKPGATWGKRWDTFCLVTPNHTVRLPGGEYAGADPHGFMPRADIEAHLAGYAAGLAAEVRSGTPARRLSARGPAGYVLDTDLGRIHSRAVVVATGAYQKAYRPESVSQLPSRLHVLDSVEYRSPGSIPDGAVLVIGGGQSACQITEELRLAGRDVVMACGRAPWFYRRVEDGDLVDWLLQTPFFDAPPDVLPSPAARLGANIQATGAGGGHDLNFRTLDAMGVRLAGHFLGCDGEKAVFAPDLAQTIAFGDEAFGMIRDLIRGAFERTGRTAPEIPPPTPLAPDPLELLDLGPFGTVVVATGYRSRYTEWIDVPGIVDDMGFPVHEDGESVVSPGMHFVGVHFLRSRKSSLLMGVGQDAARTADRVAASL
jgi:putative flavoprotein involved in K+ transport